MKTTPIRPLCVRLASHAVLVVVLAGCVTVGPAFRQPETSVENEWFESLPSETPPLPGAEAARWKSFDDPVLTALEQRAYERNRSLQVAGRHIFEARAQLAISARNLFVQQGSLSAGAARLDNTGVGPFPPEQIWTDHFRATAGWELDFREKYRRQIQSDHARLRASEAAYDNALVSLFSDAALTAASQSALIGVDNARLHPSFSLTGTHEASKET